MATKKAAAAKKPAETKKAAVKKETVKEVVKETVTEAAETEAKKTTRAKKPVVYVQAQGAEYSIDEIVKKAKEAFKAEGHEVAAAEMNIYVKPEEKMAYYVVNGEIGGKIEL